MNQSKYPTIIYEDKDLLIINKPAGMIVNRSDTAKGEFTLQDWVLSRFPSLFRVIPSAVEESLRVLLTKDPSASVGMTKGVGMTTGSFQDEEEFISRSGVVHRLDKDTSGVMLVAKNSVVFQQLKDQFKTRKVKKTYLALAHGRFEKRTGEIIAPIDRNPLNRFHFAVVEGGREARTNYRVLSEYNLDKPLGFAAANPKGLSLERDVEVYTLVSLEPLTGRTHQIRVHLGHLGHPLVGDSLYLGAKALKKDRTFCPRIFLHARSIGFIHPVSGSWLKVETGLPDDLKHVISILQPIPPTNS